MPAFTHILVPTDFGDAADHALEVALDIGRAFDAKITLMHATLLPPVSAAYAEGLNWPTDEIEDLATKELNTAVAKAKKKYDQKVEGVLMIGTPWARILEAAQQRGANLIVMGTHGRRGVTRVLLGSVAEKIVRLSPIPVMTVTTERDRKEKESQ